MASLLQMQLAGPRNIQEMPKARNFSSRPLAPVRSGLGQGRFDSLVAFVAAPFPIFLMQFWQMRPIAGLPHFAHCGILSLLSTHLFNKKLTEYKKEIK